MSDASHTFRPMDVLVLLVQIPLKVVGMATERAIQPTRGVLLP